MFCGIAVSNGERFLPVFPVTVGDFQRNRGADSDAVADAGENVGGVGLNFHAAAASVALLTSPEFVIVLWQYEP